MDRALRAAMQSYPAPDKDKQALGRIKSATTEDLERMEHERQEAKHDQAVDRGLAEAERDLDAKLRINAQNARNEAARFAEAQESAIASAAGELKAAETALAASQQELTASLSALNEHLGAAGYIVKSDKVSEQLIVSALKRRLKPKDVLKIVDIMRGPSPFATIDASWTAESIGAYGETLDGFTIQWVGEAGNDLGRALQVSRGRKAFRDAFARAKNAKRAVEDAQRQVDVKRKKLREAEAKKQPDGVSVFTR